MYRSLARRLTAWFVFVAVGMLLIVATLLTGFALSLVARSENETLNGLAAQLPPLVALYQAQGQSLGRAAPAIVKQLEEPGVNIVILNAQHKPFAGGPPLEVRYRQREGALRVVFAIGSLMGVRPQHVDLTGGSAFIAPDPARLQKTLINFGLVLFPLLLAVCVLAWVLGRYITGLALRPLISVTTALEALASGDFTPRLVSESERGEFAELTGTYNRAASQVAAAFEERRSAEAEMRQFVADAGHELRTPLTVVMGYLDVLQKGAIDDPELRRRIFEAMTDESRRMRALIDKLIVLARLEQAEPGKRERVDAAQVAKQIVAAYAPLPDRNRIALDAPEGAFVQADALELHEAIANLVENALKYAPGAPVGVSVRPYDDSVLVQVKDGGPGLSAEDQAHIFDRFYRGSNREGVGGSGLGLAIARRAVERANGTITVDSRVGSGTQVTIKLPRS